MRCGENSLSSPANFMWKEDRKRGGYLGEKIKVRKGEEACYFDGLPSSRI